MALQQYIYPCRYCPKGVYQYSVSRVERNTATVEFVCTTILCTKQASKTIGLYKLLKELAVRRWEGPMMQML